MSKKKDHAEEQADSAVKDTTPPAAGAGGTRDTGGRAATPEQGRDVPVGGASPAPGADEPAPAASGPEDKVCALQTEVLDLTDKLLRKQADFENYRKRMIRERDEAARYANAALLGDLIATIDDFERAIRSAEESRDFSAFFQGISMIERQLLETLESRWGLRRFSSTGESFDPNRHEAVLRVEGPADAKPTVVEDYQRGYYLHERVLRPAKVKVMVPAAGPGAGTSAGADAAAVDGAPGGSR
jgi:molecular chaperone GrpE